MVVTGGAAVLFLLLSHFVIIIKLAPFLSLWTTEGSAIYRCAAVCLLPVLITYLDPIMI